MEMQSIAEASKTSFWKSKDGKFGMGVTAIIAAVGLYGFYLILPFLITLAANVLTLAALLLGLFVLVYIVMDKDVQNFVWYAYKAIIRALRRILINTDPVAIINVYISHLRDQFQKLEEKIRELFGARKKLEDSIERTKSDLEEQMSKATVLSKKSPGDPQITIYTNQAGRDESQIKRFTAMLQKLNSLSTLLSEMRKACQIIIADKTNQVKSIELERDTMGTAFSAFKSAVSILKGDPDKKYYFDEAMEAIQTDISTKSGIIESFLNETSDIMKDIDLQNSTFEERGNKLLEKWQTQGMPALLISTTENVKLQVPLSSAHYEVSEPVKRGSSSNKYTDSLK